MMLAVPFLIVTLAASNTFGKEYPCTADEALCTGSGTHSISMKGVTHCCPPQATITINNSQCMCAEAPAAADELPCLQGNQQCTSSGANSFTTDSAGNLLCCPAGFLLTSFVNSQPGGQVTESCTCRQGDVSRSSLSSFMASSGRGGSGSMIMSAVPGIVATVSKTLAQTSADGNSTDVLDVWRQIGQDWKNWGQQFTKGLQSWGHNFGRSMSGTGRDLARDFSGVLQTTLQRSALPIQRAVSDTLSNLFRSIPGK